MRLLHRPANGARQRHDPLRRISDAVEAGHDGIGVGQQLVLPGRAGAAELHRGVVNALTGGDEDFRRRFRRHGAERPLGRRIERHHHDQHQRRHLMPRHDVERPRLTPQFPVMQADDDVRHDRHAGGAQSVQRRLEILDRPIEVIHLADGIGIADHVHHRHIDPGRLHALRARGIQQGGVNGDAQAREIVLQALEDREIAVVFHLVAPVRAAGKQKPLQPAGADHLAHAGLEGFRVLRRDHRRQDFGLAMIAVERTGAAGDGESRKTVTAAAAEFVIGEGTEARREETQRREWPCRRLPLQRRDQCGIKRKFVERLHRLDRCHPGHRRAAPVCAAVRSRCMLGPAAAGVRRGVGRA